MRVLTLTLVLVVVGAALLAPRPVHPDTSRHGDRAVADQVSQVVEGKTFEVVSAAVVRSDGGSAAAVVGVDHPVGPMRIESVAKIVTGMLLADAVGRGEVKLSTTLGEVFGARTFADPTVASVTLKELATHRSGIGSRLPLRWPAKGLAAITGWVVLTEDPVQTARQIDTLTTRGSFEYSNLGMALLGQALAARAGMDLPALARQRIFTPLEMTSTSLTRPNNAVVPARDELGRRVPLPIAVGWEGAGFTAYSTAPDLARLLVGISDRTAAGWTAVQPVTSPMGLGWVQGRLGGQDAVLHAGGALGASSFVALLGDWTGVVVIGNTTTAVDPIAARLLHATPLPAHPSPTAPDWLGPLITAVLALLSFAVVSGTRPGTRRPVRTVGLLLLDAVVIAVAWCVLPAGTGWQLVWIAAAVTWAMSLVRNLAPSLTSANGSNDTFDNERKSG